METCQKKKETFEHVMQKVLDFKSDSPMMKAMGELEYDSIKCIVTMEDKEAMRLLYTLKMTKGVQSIEVTKDVSMKSKKNSCMYCGGVTMKYC
eukprot:10384651-Ditylum_brightwellii.AAC.1